MPYSWVLVWKYSSPESGLGESMSVATVYGTTWRSAPCSAHAGIGLLRSLPTTPSKVLPSPGPYRCPSTLSRERFSNSATTMCSRARDLSGAGISHPPYPAAREHGRFLAPATFISLTGNTGPWPQGRGREPGRQSTPIVPCAAATPLRPPPRPRSTYAMPTAIRPPATGPARYAHHAVQSPLTRTGPQSRAHHPPLTGRPQHPASAI